MAADNREFQHYCETVGMEIPRRAYHWSTWVAATEAAEAKFTSTNNARQEIAEGACTFCCNKEMCGTCLNYVYFKHSATSAVA